MRGFVLALALTLAPSVALAQEEVESHEEAHAEAHGDPTKQFNFFDVGYGHKDVYGGKKGDGVMGPEDEPEEPMSPPFAFALINFGILLVILAKYGGPAARKMAETRSDQIKSALDEAAKLRNDALGRLEALDKKLASSEAEMKTMLENMRADAAAEKERIIADAEKQAAAMKKDAEQRIAAEIELARATLTREVALAAANAAETIIKSKATPADHTKLVDTFVQELS